MDSSNKSARIVKGLLRSLWRNWCRESDSDRPAPEKAAKDMARRIEKEIGGKAGKQAGRDFHDMKERGAPDRSLRQLKMDAVDVYRSYGKEVPRWLK